MHVESLNEDGDKEEIPEEKVQEEIARLKELLMVSENDENLIEALGHAAMVMMREKPEEDPEAEQLKGMLSRGDLPLTRPEWEGGDAAMLNQDNIQGFLDSKGIKLNMKNLDSEMQQTLIRFLTAYGEFSVERDTSQDLMNAVKQLVGGRMEMSAGRSKPTDKPQDFASREIALAWKLGDLAPKLNNDFLSNFVANVSEKLKSSGEMGAQRVSRDEAKIINLILKGAQGAAPAPMEGRELREINEVQDWFEQFDPTKLAMAKYQETLLREKLEKEVEEDEEEDDSVMSEDEVWETSMEFVNTKDTPDELKVMANEISRTDLNRIIENIEEVWVGDIANEVREILAENLAEVLEADEDEYKDEKDVRPPTCKKCGEEHYGACPLYDSVEEAKKGLRPNKVEDNMMRRLGKGRKGDVASGPPEKHYDDKYSRMAAKRMKPKESAVDEVSPPGWEKTVKKMKKHKEIDNPWALAWHMKNKGYKASESIEEIKEVARLMELSGIKLDKVSGEKE